MSRGQAARCAGRLLIALLVALSASRAVAGESVLLEDAERFAAMLRRHAGGDLRPEVIDAEYLRPGTEGLVIFTPGRLRDADHLAAAILADRAGYQRAIDTCLPLARQMQKESEAAIARVAELLGATAPAPVYVVLGARDSGGTADARGLVLGLEVLCRNSASPEEFRSLFRDFVVHETVHVYQARAGVDEDPVALLRSALLEGLPDYVMERVLEGRAVAGAARDAYGRTHEAALWRDFFADVHAGRRTADTAWFYKPPTRPDQPEDMGYWIGKRICEAYMARHAADEKAALAILLEMKDEQAILATSGYAPAH